MIGLETHALMFRLDTAISETLWRGNKRLAPVLSAAVGWVHITIRYLPTDTKCAISQVYDSRFCTLTRIPYVPEEVKALIVHGDARLGPTTKSQLNHNTDFLRNLLIGV